MLCINAPPRNVASDPSLRWADQIARCQENCVFVDDIFGRAGATFSVALHGHLIRHPTVNLDKVAIMGRLWCCLLVFVLPVVFSVDFQEVSKESRSLSFFAKPSQLGQHRIARRSIWHRLRRDTDTREDTCNALQGYETKLADNTHSVSH